MCIRDSIIAAETPAAYVRVDKRWIDACRLAKDSNPRPHSVINTRSDLAGWPRTTWYHIESLCPLPCIYIPIVLWSRPSVDPLTILLIKLLKSYSLVLMFYLPNSDLHMRPWRFSAGMFRIRLPLSAAAGFLFCRFLRLCQKWLFVSDSPVPGL